MATVSNGAGIAEIAAVFGRASNTSIAAIATVVGVPANSPISTYYGRSPTPTPTPTPTPAPSLTKPSISPGAGTAGQTTFTATDGIPGGAYDTFTARWLLNGADQGGGGTITTSAGTLVRQNVATGPGGSTTVNSDPVTVSAPAAAQFTPDGGYQYLEKQFITELSLLCSQNATWTHTVVSGSGGVANIPTGTAATGILFRVTAAGAAGQRVSRSQKWNVRGQAADGTIRDFTVELTALGDNA